MEQSFLGFEDNQHRIERQKIVDGAYRSDIDHEIANQLDIPMPRFSDQTRIYIVCRYRDLGEIVQEIVEQDLSRQHRQEGQKDRGSGHAEHVAEIRTGSHQQILHDVSESLATLNNAVVKHLEAALEQNDIGRIFRHVYSC